jgi:hypothetical protein
MSEEYLHNWNLDNSIQVKRIGVPAGSSRVRNSDTSSRSGSPSALGPRRSNNKYSPRTPGIGRAVVEAANIGLGPGSGSPLNSYGEIAEGSNSASSVAGAMRGFGAPGKMMPRNTYKSEDEYPIDDESDYYMIDEDGKMVVMPTEELFDDGSEDDEESVDEEKKSTLGGTADTRERRAISDEFKRTGKGQGYDKLETPAQVAAYRASYGLGPRSGAQRINQPIRNSDAPPKRINPIGRPGQNGQIYKKSAKQPLRDPKGGLTAAGRRHFKETEGANLKPGVKGPADTPTKMRRKGSFLVRFFTNPSGPMADEKGRPTRLALSARAWGEPVPQNLQDAAKLAAKGRRLLDRYRSHVEKQKGKKSFEQFSLSIKSLEQNNDVKKLSIQTGRPRPQSRNNYGSADSIERRKEGPNRNRNYGIPSTRSGVPKPYIEGNINLSKRRPVNVGGGNRATVRSIGITDRRTGYQVNIPTIGPRGEQWNDRQATDAYYSTGRHLGKFRGSNAIGNSNANAEYVHRQEAQRIGGKSMNDSNPGSAVATSERNRRQNFSNWINGRNPQGGTDYPSSTGPLNLGEAGARQLGKNRGRDLMRMRSWTNPRPRPGVRPERGPGWSGPKPPGPSASGRPLPAGNSRGGIRAMPSMLGKSTDEDYFSTDNTKKFPTDYRGRGRVGNKKPPDSFTWYGGGSVTISPHGPIVPPPLYNRTPPRRNLPERPHPPGWKPPMHKL